MTLHHRITFHFLILLEKPQMSSEGNGSEGWMFVEGMDFKGGCVLRRSPIDTSGVNSSSTSLPEGYVTRRSGRSICVY